jgi:hypothetical protein
MALHKPLPRTAGLTMDIVRCHDKAIISMFSLPRSTVISCRYRCQAFGALVGPFLSARLSAVTLVIFCWVSGLVHLGPGYTSEPSKRLVSLIIDSSKLYSIETYWNFFPPFSARSLVGILIPRTSLNPTFSWSWTECRFGAVG